MEGEHAGHAILSLRKDLQTVRIYSIAVDPRFGRRGSRRRCFRKAEKYARLHNKSQLSLEVRYDNTPAIALYEKWGFRQFGEHEDYYVGRRRCAALQETALFRHGAGSQPPVRTEQTLSEPVRLLRCGSRPLTSPVLFRDAPSKICLPT